MNQYQVCFSSMILSALLVSALEVSANGNVGTTLRFDELPFQSVDGLVAFGIDFDFKIDGVDSEEAYFHSYGPGVLNYVDDPSLAGSAAGILTLSFDHPISQVSFGAAIGTSEPLSPGIRVELYNSALELLQTVEVDTVASSTIGFSEGLVAYSGAPFSQARLQFLTSANSFAIDNLSYSIPEPSCCSLVVFVVTGIMTVYWKLPVSPRTSYCQLLCSEFLN